MQVAVVKAKRGALNSRHAAVDDSRRLDGFAGLSLESEFRARSHAACDGLNSTRETLRLDKRAINCWAAC
jgi:hypothetical protein